MNDEYDENDLQAQQHADTKRRTDQLLERHKQRIQKLKVTAEETEGLKEKIRAKLEEHKNLMESSNNNNNSSSSNENDYSQDYNDDIRVIFIFYIFTKFFKRIINMMNLKKI